MYYVSLDGNKEEKKKYILVFCLVFVNALLINYEKCFIFYLIVLDFE